MFIVGVGSGSWLTNLLGCVRAGVIRGQGNAAGGLPAVPAVCAGPIAAMLAHDMQDTTDPFAGGELARDRIVKMNGCGASTVPYVYDGTSATTPCLTYEGCRSDDPVVWCPTAGEGHADEVPITTLGLWRFFQQFERAAVSGLASASSRGAMVVLPGKAEGTFDKSVTYPLAADAFEEGLATGDVDGDGKVDILVSEDGTSDTIWKFSRGIDGRLGRSSRFTYPTASDEVAGGAIIVTDINLVIQFPLPQACSSMLSGSAT